MELKQLMTLPDFVAQFSISRSAVYREVSAGRLQFTKVGRRSYITRSDAQVWLEQLRKATSILSSQ